MAYVALLPNGRPGPKLLLRRVTEPKTGKNRMHVDIEVPDINAECDRLTALGALRVSESGAEVRSAGRKRGEEQLDAALGAR